MRLVVLAVTLSCLPCNHCLAFSRNHWSSLAATPLSVTPAAATDARLNDPHVKLLVHWKGEGVEGYSMQFRQLELEGALAALTDQSLTQLALDYDDALDYDGDMAEVKRVRFNAAMQYIDGPQPMSRRVWKTAAERCSLVHALYEVVAEGSSLEELNELAIKNGAFADLGTEVAHSDATWSVRVRQYGQESTDGKDKRSGGRTRSMTMERQALRALKPLLLTFGGSVDLAAPDVKIYVFDGLASGMALARRLATGPRVSTMAPATRICVTNTPLCPIAAFSLCNVAGVRDGQRVLDPYAGSCATLLAAAMMADLDSVGIEIAHSGLVNRDDIRRDFATRDLALPKALIHGDSTDADVRSAARAAIGDRPFDCIVTDPPYGIRESMIDKSPIYEMMVAIAEDRAAGTPLLRIGGKLVCFVPVQEGETLEQVLPGDQWLQEAGLEIEVVREQPLNAKLSRWLVSFVCVR